MHDKELKLSDVWKTCNKIRAAIFRVGLNLWDYYLPLDPNRNCLISESKFISVLAGPLRGLTGLSHQEIGEIADYFRVQDGRILYTQFCEVINNSVPDFAKNEPLVTGLEWDDPMQVNTLSSSEERRLSLLITKIAAVVNMRRLILRPFFQDYELVSKNNGTVTIAHFARILSYLGIMVSSDDFNLLVKKFLKDSYTLNYIAFLAAVDEAVTYLDEHGLLDLGGDILSLFPGRIINAELPKLPRPEIGRIRPAVVFGNQSIFHPVLNPTPEYEALLTVIQRIQRHVWDNRIRVNEFFRDFDPLRCGKITASQFHRALDSIGVSGLHRLYISLPEIQSLVVQYRDPIDPERVCWQTFEDDINSVFTTKELEKYPAVKVEAPPQDIMELPRKGAQQWQKVDCGLRDLCEDALFKVKQKALKRRIILKPVFKDYDQTNNGHVSRSQMRQCLSSYGVLLSDEEMYALEQRFNDDLGFNYFWFLKELESKKYEQALYEPFVQRMKLINAEKPPSKPHKRETDIIMILAKIKGKVVRERIRVMEFLRGFDPHNELVIPRADFERGLSNCRLELTQAEVKTLMEVFASPMRPQFIDYRRFSDVVEEAFSQSCLERAPLIVPLQHIPTRDCDRTFLNYDERKLLSAAMEKLSKKPELQMNLLSLFQDYDKTKCGTVSQGIMTKVLSMRGMSDLISSHEFEVVCKCFGFERGLRDEVDYRAFCKALDILYMTAKNQQ